MLNRTRMIKLAAILMIANGLVVAGLSDATAQTSPPVSTDPYYAMLQADAPVAYWSMAGQESDTVFDLVRRTPLRATGPTTFGICDAPSGHAALLREAGAQLSASVPLTTSWTIEVWFRPAPLYDGSFLTLNSDTGAVSLALQHSSASGPERILLRTEAESVVTPIALAPDVWHVIDVSGDNGHVRVFADGSASAGTVTEPSHFQAFTIGANPSNQRPIAGFVGLVAGLAVFAYPLDRAHSLRHLKSWAPANRTVANATPHAAISASPTANATSPFLHRRLALGDGFASYATSDSSVWTWGDNYLGYPLGPPWYSTTPAAIPGFGDVVSVASAGYHTLALRSDGTVWGWGTQQDYDLEAGPPMNAAGPTLASPAQMTGLPSATAVAAGVGSSFALDANGEVWAWGNNLGTGPAIQPSPKPSIVPGLANVVAIAAGYGDAIAIEADGSAWTWGASDSELGAGSSPVAGVVNQVKSPVALTGAAVGQFHMAAIANDGSVWAWGANFLGQLGSPGPDSSVPIQVPSLSSMADIGASEESTMAVSGSGAVYDWGDNYYGQLGDGGNTTQTTPEMATRFPSAAGLAGGFTTFTVVDQSGLLWSSGRNNAGQLGDGNILDSNVPVATQVPFVPITHVPLSAAGTSGLAVLETGGVWGWGGNYHGQLGDGSFNDNMTGTQASNLSNVLAVASGGTYSLALDSNGAVWAFGGETSGQLGDNGALTDDQPNAYPVSELSKDVSAISASTTHAVALLHQTVYAWGLDTDGELGEGFSGEAALAPLPVPGLPSITAISAGVGFTLALDGSANVWMWGDNTNGEAGPGNHSSEVTSPIRVGGLQNIVAIAAGGNHALALDSGGQVWAWGGNDHGQLGQAASSTPNPTPTVVAGLAGSRAISAGDATSLAVSTDGTAFTWGANDAGQLGTGAALDSATPSHVIVSGSAFHAEEWTLGGAMGMAVTAAGQVYQWGRYPQDDTGGLSSTTPVPAPRKPTDRVRTQGQESNKDDGAPPVPVPVNWANCYFQRQPSPNPWIAAAQGKTWTVYDGLTDTGTTPFGPFVDPNGHQIVLRYGDSSFGLVHLYERPDHLWTTPPGQSDTVPGQSPYQPIVADPRYRSLMALTKVSNTGSPALNTAGTKAAYFYHYTTTGFVVVQSPNGVQFVATTFPCVRLVLIRITTLTSRTGVEPAPRGLVTAFDYAGTQERAVHA